MIRMYQSQTMILLSKKDLYILLGSFLPVIAFLLYASNYYMEYEYLVIHNLSMFYEYLGESVSFIKFCIVVYGVYLVILLRKLHYLDGLYLSRNSRTTVIFSRILVLLTVVLLINTILFILFLLVGYFLTPYMISYDYFKLYFSIQLFGVFYSLLGYLLMLLSHVIYAPLFVILIYFISSIFSPYYVSYDDISTLEKVNGFIFNDLVIFSDYTISSIYGNTHILMFITILIGSVLLLYTKKDIVIL